MLVHVPRRLWTSEFEEICFRFFIYTDTVAPECHLLVIDECSTVNNADMVSILQKAKFQALLLVGDTYQIDSIRFGNWFTAIRHFMPEKAVHELTEPYRARNNRRLLDIELEKPIDKSEIMWYPLEYLGKSTEGNSIVRFSVYETKNADEEDDHTTSRTIVPFQIAYAVSIHKAQGLEYNSVTIVITDEVDELITHNIFYTAITRAQSKLRIYWTPEVEHKVLEHIRPRNIDSDVELLKSYLSEPLSRFPF